MAPALLLSLTVWSCAPADEPGAQEPAPAEPATAEPAGAEPAAPAAAGPAVASPPRQTPRLEAGTTAGELGEESGLLDDGTRFQAYRIEAGGHQRLRLRARSDHFDPVLYLVDPAGTPILFNDDLDPKAGAAAGLDAYLAAPGPHQVWVNAFSGGGGAYELSLEVEDHAEAERTLAARAEARGWLTPADERGPAGRPADRWRLTLPAEPVLVWLDATAFDPRLGVEGAGGVPAAVNDDLDPIGGDRRARIALFPGPGRPAGSEVTLAVEASGQGPAQGGYRLWTTPLPLDRRPELALRVRPLVISCPGDASEHEQWAGDFLRAAALADEVWRQCRIRVEVEGGAPRVVCVPGLPWVVRVDAAGWTPDEELLQALAERTGPDESLLTVFAVGGTDGGERHALAYPTTRYAPRRAGIILSRTGLERGRDEVFLAHEIGHVLGLGHSAADDGDPDNDVAGNVMAVASEDDAAPAQDARDLSRLQCAVARGAPHWLIPAAAGGAGAPRSRGLARTDRLLRPAEERAESLSEGDPTHAEGRKIEVFYFTGDAGESVTIEASSSEFDPILLLDGPSGDRLATDDDGGGGRTARIEVALPSSGDYSVGVTSALPGEIGHYRLVIRRP